MTIPEIGVPCRRPWPEFVSVPIFNRKAEIENPVALRGWETAPFGAAEARTLPTTGAVPASGDRKLPVSGHKGSHQGWQLEESGTGPRIGPATVLKPADSG